MKTTELAGEALIEDPGASERHAALFERIAGRIYRYFLKNLWDAGEAEELAQRTFLELERSLRERAYDPARSFNAWMWLKAHTVLAAYFRERARRPGRLADNAAETLADGRAAPARAAEARLDAAAILREVQRRLGEETYEIFVLYYEGGLTQAEVAETVGRDRKTVAARLREAGALAESMVSTPTR